MRFSTSATRRTLRPALFGIGSASVLAVLLRAIRWHQDWNLSEGTYALTARALLNGGDLYGGIVVAQPPALFVMGAGVLAIGDSLDLLRAAVAMAQLVALALIAVAAWRITGSRWALAVTPPLGVLLPWSVHEHGMLLPEAVALPCLAGALVLAPRHRGAPWAGALLALLVAIKLPMALPALCGIGVAADRRGAVWTFGATGALLAVAFLVVFGTGVVDDVVLAQLDVGRHGLRDMAGLGAQAAWNLAPLGLGVLAAAVAWRRGWRPADRRQWRVAVALGAGTALTLASTVKVGTSLAVAAPVEAMALPLAIAGAVAWLEADGVFAARHRHRPRRRRVVAATVVALLLAQSLSLLAAPRRGGALFVRPLSSPAWGMQMSGEEVDARVAALRRCPPGMASGEGPVVTFRAGRRMPGGQPDVFLPSRSRRLAEVARRVDADLSRCSAPAR